MFRTKLALIGVALAILAGCEATPVFDPANYYSASRYYEGPLPTEKRFWDVGLKDAAN